MLGKQANFRKAVNFETSTTSANQSRNTAIFQDKSPKKDKINKENSLGFKIPMSYVVSGAQNLCSEARYVQQLELAQRSCKIDEFCKDLLSKGKKSPQDNTVSKHSSGKQVWTPNYSRITERCSLFHEESIKRARKQEFERNQRRIPTAKRRPLSTSSQQVWFMNKDTTSAILSSKSIAKKFKSIPKASTKPVPNVIKKPGSKTELVDKVPKFTTVPNEYQNRCRNKSVGEIMDLKLCGKGYGELLKRESQNRNKRLSSATTSQVETHSAHHWRKHRNDETKKSTEISIQRTEHCRRTPYAQFSKSSPTPEHFQYQVPKNIYIRKTTGGETMEDLVEVRNQDDLDVLNTIATLQLVDSSKHGATSGKCFKDLRDYELYCYPC